MDSVNTSSDIQSKSPNFAFNFNNSLGNMLNNGSTIDSMFANLLLQPQPPAPPPVPPAPPQSNAGANQPANNTNNENNSDSNDNAGITNNSSTVNAANAPAAAQGLGSAHKHSNWSADGKSSRHSTKNTSGASHPNPAISNANAPQQPAAQPSAANAAPNSTPVSSGNSQSDPEPGDISADLSLTPAGAGTTSANSATVDATQTGPDADPLADIKQILADLANINSASSADPDSGSDPSTPANGTDGTSSQLLSLLTQLEQLAAAAHAGSLTQLTNLNSTTTADAGQNSLPPATSVAGIGGDSQNKIDLKALLTAITHLDTGTDGSDPTSDALGLSANSSPSSSAATPANPPQSGSTQAQDAANKLIDTAFLNLFSLSPGDANPPANLPVFNPGVVASAMLDNNDDGASLDTDAQGQSGAGARDNATNLPDTNSLLPTTAGAQAASPYNFASQLSALRATQGGATGLPTPIDQVVLQLSRGLAKDGSSQMTIQLRPAELGRVDVKLSIGSDGNVQGTVTADNPATLNLLLKDVRGLERALQEAGLRADSGSLQFGLRGDGQPGGGSGQTASNQSGLNNAGNFSSSSTSLPAFNPVETYYLTPGGVNMRV